MDITTLLPILSKALGRDISKEVDLFFRGRASIGAALNPTGQKFFIDNWPKIVEFMETKEGKQAIVVFIEAWAKSLVPPPMAKEPEPIPITQQTDNSPSLGVI